MRRAIAPMFVIAVIAVGWRLWPGLSLPSFGWFSSSDDLGDEPDDPGEPAAQHRSPTLVAAATPAVPAYDPWNPPPRDPFAPQLEVPPQPDQGHDFARQLMHQFMEHREALRHCYRSQIPAPAENLTVRVVIMLEQTKAGTHVDARIESLDATPVAPELAACVRDVVTSFDVNLPDETRSFEVSQRLTLTAQN